MARRMESSRRFVRGPAAVLLMAGLWAGSLMVGPVGCGEPPTKPGPVKYNVYVAALDWVDGNATDPLFIIDADSMVVIDSIPQIGSLWDMEVSPDGRWLYTYVHRGSQYGCPNDSLRRIDIKNKRIEWAIPSGLSTSITLLDHGNLILRRWSHYGDCPAGQDLLDAMTGEVIRSLPDGMAYGEGPVEGTKVAVVMDRKPPATGQLITSYDVITGETAGSFIPRSPTGTELYTAFVRLHSDGHQVLVMAGIVENIAWAIIGDLSTGEALLTHSLYNVFGEGQFSADGTIAVTSDASGSLTVLDLDSLVWRPTTATGGGQVDFVGDSKIVITCGIGDYAHATDPIVKVDLQSLMILARRELPLPEPLLGALAVGMRP